MKRTLKDIAKDIHENCENIHFDKITWEDFDLTAKKLWREVDLGQLNIIGSRTYRRMGLVQKHLSEIR